MGPEEIAKDLRALDLGQEKGSQPQGQEKDSQPQSLKDDDVHPTSSTKFSHETSSPKMMNQLQQQQQNTGHQQRPSVIICDAWYGFPAEKRPRKERILAVSKQIYNFLRWRCEFNTLRQGQRKNVSSAEEYSSYIAVIGKVDDVNAIHDRVNNLFGSKDEGQSLHDVRANPLAKCAYLPGVTLEEIVSGRHHDLFSQAVSDTEEESEVVTHRPQHGYKESIVYLSPDADERLDPFQAPPRIVVVGMLVDRKVQPNRSKLRAQEFNDQSTNKEGGSDDKNVRMQLRRLPMDNLRVVDLKDDEPLNIDTVMEIMERWWGYIGERKFKTLDQDQPGDSRPFADAAIRALHSHRKRHPNRTIHGGISTTDTN
jgi:hypothetical protein